MPKDLFKNRGTEPTHEDFSTHLRKHIADKEGTQIVAEPIDIFSIIPDVTQPRRAIPFSVRRSYENTAHNVPLMLEEWHLKAEQSLGFTIQVRELITGIEEIDIEQDTPALLRDYLDLISLAASIHREGLTNAITVSDVGDLKRIETGERRYLAHHLLTMYVDKVKYAKIAAQTVTRDVWRQASENGARKPLTAIGLARQLALLIMNMYEGDKDVFFDKFEAMVYPNECDRKFYMQVYNGNTYRIKRGMAQKILDVTGLKSKNQISQYRNLLKLTSNEQVNDILWIRADEENWTEGGLREISQFPVDQILSVITRANWSIEDLRNLREKPDTLTTVNLSPQNQPSEAPVRTSALPDRPAPSTAGNRVPPPPPARYTEPVDDDFTGYDDIEPDDDFNDYDMNANVDQWQTHTPPAPQQHSQASALIYAQRQAIAPTVRMLIQLANQLDGQNLQLNTGDKIFEGKTLIKMLQFYLEGNMRELLNILNESGEDAMRGDIDEAFVQIIDIFEHLAREVAGFMHEVINTAIDYSD